VAMKITRQRLAEEKEFEDRFAAHSDISGKSDASFGESTVAELNLENKLVGCEITFNIFVGTEQRQLDGLADIEAADIAVMIQQQIFDPDSPLFVGKLTQTVLDVQYKLSNTQRQFAHWEDFFIHSVHPTFFGYNTRPPKSHFKSLDEHGLINGRLPSGVAPLNPTLLFNERNKDTFQELNAKPIILPPWERAKKVIDADSDDESQAGKSKADSTVSGHVLDLNVDEFANEVDVTGGKKLKLFRPNMSCLTFRDIQRLKRLHKAFEEYYEDQMRKGLVDGTGLRAEQFQALKDRDSAYRIYRTARQKFYHTHKNLSDELILPPLEVTKISHDVFQGWMDEALQEDQQRLREARIMASRRKNVLQQEAILRRGAAEKRIWVIDKFVSECENPLEVGHAFEECMLKQEILSEFVKTSSENSADSIDPDTDIVLKKIIADRTNLKKLVISEEKKTRKLFSMVMERKVTRCVSTPLVPNELPIVDCGDGFALASGAVNDDALTSLPILSAEAAKVPEGDEERITEGALDNLFENGIVEVDSGEAPKLDKTDLLEFLSQAQLALKEASVALEKASKQQKREERLALKRRRLESHKTLHGSSSKNINSLDSDDNDDSDEDFAEPTDAENFGINNDLRGTASIDCKLSKIEFALVEQIQWIKTIAKYPQFLNCLILLPTLDEATYARDELIQVRIYFCLHIFYSL
jgi:hypothetical protein